MQLSLAQNYGVGTMLAVALAAVVLTALFYRRAFGSLGIRRWAVLLALRVVAILLIVGLLFQPVLSYPKESGRKPAVIFLLDASASMSLADDASGRSRFDRAREKMERWQEKLQDDFRLLPIAFAEQPWQLDGPKSLRELSPTGKATSLVESLRFAAARLPPAEVAAVLLLSDGIHNAAGNPSQTARQLGVVVHSIGVGASVRNSLTYRDIQVVGLDCPDRMMLGNIARVTASIDAVGLGGRTATVTLEQDGRPVARRELTLDDAEGSQTASLEFRPTEKGRHTYTVCVEPAAEEKIVENNRRSAVATVVEKGIRVLYLEGTLRTEYGALVDRFLAKDPDVEFCALVQTKPNVFLRRTNMTGLRLDAIPNDPQTIGRFDVFLIGDLDSSYFRPRQQEMFVERVRQGAGLLMLGGYHSLGPGGYDGTPLGDALPLELGSRRIGQVTEPFLPVLTPEGARHPVFANIAGFFPTRQGPPTHPGLPALDGCTRVQGARPSANVLAVCPDSLAAMPVLAVQPLERGRTAVFAGDTTRRWQQGPQARDRESPFTRFWGQTVRWLAGREESVEATAGVTVSTDKAYYEPGESIRISAVVRDRQGRGTTDASVVATIRRPDGKTRQTTLSPVAGPGGHYAGVFGPKTSGTHAVTVEARQQNALLASDTMSVEVGRTNLEFERLDLDEKTLERIAEATGGRYVPLATADHLIDQLDRRQERRIVRIERRLYWPPGFWAAFVGVLTIEWVLRRKYRLR